MWSFGMKATWLPLLSLIIGKDYLDLNGAVLQHPAGFPPDVMSELQSNYSEVSNFIIDKYIEEKYPGERSVTLL